ncbi:acyltransferase [Candidatus Methanomassiliicoccus intestinalis]|uniref:acyltransferase n=1 Tax=Candidatus Methanomassiliicoccus intestinalis TaxID=1406512 RepID=UPI0037DC92BF
MERKNFIDNLRWICILLLIPYHAAMAYNCWGESNYIILGTSKILSSLIVAISPWFMTLLFLLAGMSAKYSLARRSYKQFMMERVLKLLLPLIFGTLFFMPILTYIADKTNCGYTGDFFQHYTVFFTKWTDISGYDGGFSIGHLWFLLYLFIISFFVCLFDILFKRQLIKIKTVKFDAWATALLILLAMCAYPIKLGGENIITFLLLYLIGYYILSDDQAVGRLIKFKYFYLMNWIILTLLNIWLFIWTDYDLPVLSAVLNFLAGGFGILALFCMGHRFFNGTNRSTKFLTSISFCIYIVHFIWVVAFEYWFSLINIDAAFIFILSVLCSMGASIITCIGIKHCPMLNVMFGYKPKDKVKL